MLLAVAVKTVRTDTPYFPYWKPQGRLEKKIRDQWPTLQYAPSPPPRADKHSFNIPVAVQVSTEANMIRCLFRHAQRRLEYRAPSKKQES